MRMALALDEVVDVRVDGGKLSGAEVYDIPS
jgi:hypothetical protein